MLVLVWWQVLALEPGHPRALLRRAKACILRRAFEVRQPPARCSSQPCWGKGSCGIRIAVAVAAACNVAVHEEGGVALHP